MTIIKQDAPVIVNSENSMDTWCVFEHRVTMQEGEPPTVILVGACRLVEVYRLVEGKTNSEWANIFRNGGHVLVTIVATTEDKREATLYASQLMRDMRPIPRCNLSGYSIKGGRRSVICVTNGKRYHNQGEAAADLGVSASSISRHLRGELTHAGGLKFTYAPDERPVPTQTDLVPQ